MEERYRNEIATRGLIKFFGSVYKRDVDLTCFKFLVIVRWSTCKTVSLD